MPWWSGRRARALLVAPVTAVLLLAGCTDGEPTAAESTTAPPVETPTPTPTPTETPAVDVTVKPERPAALDGPPSVEGAVAVAEYFLLLFPYVNATGDLRDWSDLSNAECVYCTNVAARVTEKFNLGLHDIGGESSITEAIGNEVDPGRWYMAKIRLLQAESATVDATGSVVESYPGAVAYRVDLAVVWDGGIWSIREATPTEEVSP